MAIDKLPKKMTIKQPVHKGKQAFFPYNMPRDTKKMRKFTAVTAINKSNKRTHNYQIRS